jgi:hypothetical protein
VTHGSQIGTPRPAPAVPAPVTGAGTHRPVPPQVHLGHRGLPIPDPRERRIASIDAIRHVREVETGMEPVAAPVSSSLSLLPAYPSQIPHERRTASIDAIRTHSRGGDGSREPVAAPPCRRRPPIVIPCRQHPKGHWARHWTCARALGVWNH